MLNACRSWRDLAGDGWASKSNAARWAARRWPGGDLLAQALELRHHPEGKLLDPAEVARLVQCVAGLAGA